MYVHRPRGAPSDRHREVEAIAASLPRRTAQLMRLLYRESGNTLPRGMASVLAAVGDTPQRITQLAEREGVSQPSVTRTVERLEAQGLVQRERDPTDRRVVQVTITRRGVRELARVRARYATVLRRLLAERPDRELRLLREAGEALQRAIDALQRTQ